jgi:small subunit ribosomal protein S18
MTKKVKLKISARLFKKKTRRNGNSGPKNCRFCGTTDQLAQLDYKNAGFLKSFMTERGKILPSRISGICCKHQRNLSSEIRKSRTMALLPYSAQYYNN